MTALGVPGCAWCGATGGRELVTVADGRCACTGCWDSDGLAPLRRLLAARAELHAALTGCGIDSGTAAYADPARVTAGIGRLRRVAARAAVVLAEAGKERER